MIKPSATNYCATLAKEPCAPLIDPVKDDAVKTSIIYAEQYGYCQLKHDILIECQKDK